MRPASESRVCKHQLGGGVKLTPAHLTQLNPPPNTYYLNFYKSVIAPYALIGLRGGGGGRKRVRGDAREMTDLVAPAQRFSVRVKDQVLKESKQVIIARELHYAVLTRAA